MEKRDVLWKGIIEDCFSSFLDYFFLKYAHQIDKSKGFEFLDKELQKISPKSNDSKRFADKLVKVYLKNGKIIWMLIHIEIQGYPDKKFEERMYIYQYRIFDKYKVPTAALAIFTDDDPNFHPKKYRTRVFDTISEYRYSTYKLSDKKVGDFGDPKNPFSIIMETAWWGLRKNKLTGRQLFSKKINLYRKLRKQGFEDKKKIFYSLLLNIIPLLKNLK